MKTRPVKVPSELPRTYLMYSGITPEEAAALFQKRLGFAPAEVLTYDEFCYIATEPPEVKL